MTMIIQRRTFRRIITAALLVVLFLPTFNAFAADPGLIPPDYEEIDLTYSIPVYNQLYMFQDDEEDQVMAGVLASVTIPESGPVIIGLGNHDSTYHTCDFEMQISQNGVIQMTLGVGFSYQSKYEETQLYIDSDNFSIFFHATDCSQSWTYRYEIHVYLEYLGTETTVGDESDDEPRTYSGADPTDTPVPTNTPYPTDTDIPPTNTPYPTDTPRPTSTPRPSSNNSSGGSSSAPTNTPRPANDPPSSSDSDPLDDAPVADNQPSSSQPESSGGGTAVTYPTTSRRIPVFVILIIAVIAGAGLAAFTVFRPKKRMPEPAYQPAPEPIRQPESVHQPVPEPMPQPAPAPLKPKAPSIVWPTGAGLEIEKSPFIIGRSADSDLRLPEANISRTHARLVETDGTWFIQDMESALGILVNGERVSAAQLNNGDVITIGATMLTFRMHS